MLTHRPLRVPFAVRGGLLFGCAVLPTCRPVPFAGVAARLRVAEFGRSLIARHYLWVNATFVLVALLWVGRNFIVADTLTLSSIASVNLYFHRAAAVEARVQGKSAEDVRAEWERLIRVPVG